MTDLFLLLHHSCYSFMQHPETLLPMTTIDDPVQRFVSVVKFYLSGWHLKPPYVCTLLHIFFLVCHLIAGVFPT